MPHNLNLIVEPEMLAVCRLWPDEPIPAWATVGGFCSITRTADELSVVCPDDRRIPADVRCEHGWRYLRVAGSQPFGLTGVLSSILEPLAAASISIFAISTFDTDYVLVKAADLERAIATLREAGHEIEDE